MGNDIRPIIITDDSPTIRMTLSTALQPLKRPIILAPNGVATMRLAMQHRPALCILDYDLSDGDLKGDAIARTLVGQNVQVMLYSTLEESKLQELGSKIGCAWHCKMGTTLVMVREHVRKLIEGEGHECHTS